MNHYKNCKVLMLPSKEPSNIIVIDGTIFFITLLHEKGGHYVYYDKEEKEKYSCAFCIEELEGGIYQHLCILSEEEFKEDEFKLGEFVGVNAGDEENTCWEIYAWKPNSCEGPELYKVIASSYPPFGLPLIPVAFMKEYCENDGIDLVQVKYEEFGVGINDEDNYPIRIKIEFDNTISLKPIKNNWTREDIESLVTFTKHLNYMDGSKPQHEFTPKEILNKWLQDKH